MNYFNRKNIPEENKTILEVIDVDHLLPIILFVYVYFAKGNWILEIQIKSGAILLFKYPKEIKEKQFYEYLYPLLSKLSDDVYIR